MRVCLGGTFEPFHVGHEALLREAARGADELFIGVTDAGLERRQDRSVASWTDRGRRVQKFLEHDLGFRGEVVIRALRDAMGPAASGDYDAIAVSYETRRGADKINATRLAAGLEPLQIRIVPPVLGQDSMPVNATAIAAGSIDRRGRRLTPVRLAVGSANPVKLAGAEAEFAAILDLPLQVRGFAVDSCVPEQPIGAQTLAGARARAAAALEAWPEADYTVGVEAGIVDMPGDDVPVDVQACVVMDRLGHVTTGWGPGFHYPAWVRDRALRGEMISDILGPVAENASIGGTTGAVGYLSDGHLDRTDLTRTAVTMAFLPRIRRSLYEVEPLAHPDTA